MIIHANKIVLCASFFIIVLCRLNAADIDAAYKTEEIDSIAQAQKELDVADSETLVVYDIDDTLIEQSEKLLVILSAPQDAFNENDKIFVQKFQKMAKAYAEEKYPFSKNIMDIIYSRILTKQSAKPVESMIANVIHDLQKRNVRVIALTNRSVGPWGIIENMESLSYSRICEIGIDLNLSFTTQNISMENLTPNNGFYPVFYKGILLTARNNSKGRVLSEFLNRMQWAPKKVVVFDDKKDGLCLESITKEMQKRHIPCTCFWYRAIFRNKPQFDQKIITYQWNYLIKYGEFLTTEEVIKNHASYTTCTY